MVMLDLASKILIKIHVLLIIVKCYENSIWNLNRIRARRDVFSNKTTLDVIEVSTTTYHDNFSKLKFAKKKRKKKKETKDRQTMIPNN